MKKIFIAILLLIGIQSFSQSGYVLINGRYRWVATMADSALHIPRYNGVPSGLRVGSSTHDGALAADTLNGAVYFYWNAAWNKMALYADISEASSNIYNTNGILSGNRTLTGLNNTYSLNLDSLNSFRVQRNGTTRLLMNSTVTELASPNSTATVSVNNSNALISYSSNAFRAMADSFTATNKIVYETNINGSLTTPNSLVTRSLVDSLITAGGGTPTLQQVTDIGSVTTNKITAQSFHASSPGEGFKINIDASGNVITTGYAAAITQNNGNGDLYIQPSSASETAGNPPSFGTPNIILHADGKINLPNTVYNSGSEIVALGIDTLTNKVYRKTAAGGGGVTAANLPLRISGSTVSADTSVAFSPSLTTNDRLIKVLDSLKALGNSEPWYKWYMDVGNPSNAFMWRNSANGGSISTAGAVYDGWMNSVDYITGTATNGHAYSHHGNNGIVQPIAISNSYRYNYGIKVRLEDLSDGTDTYRVWTGFADDHTTFASIVDGVYFSYTDGESSGQWVCITKSNSSATTTASGVTVAADTDYELEISVYNGSAYFFINKVLVHTETNTIPTGTTRVTSMNHVLKKSAGTTSRTMHIEWMAYGKRSN